MVARMIITSAMTPVGGHRCFSKHRFKCDFNPSDMFMLVRGKQQPNVMAVFGKHKFRIQALVTEYVVYSKVLH